MFIIQKNINVLTLVWRINVKMSLWKCLAISDKTQELKYVTEKYVLLGRELG